MNSTHQHVHSSLGTAVCERGNFLSLIIQYENDGKLLIYV